MTQLNDATRRSALQRMKDVELDVLVVGGGVTGAGAALDAAARGLSVGLIERGDLASGASSASSKLIHGGLRYLEQLNFGLVREALRERGLLLHRIAPHLVRPVEFVLPLRHRVWERLYVSAGVFLYDRLGGARQMPAAAHLSRGAVRRLAPALRRDRYIGGVRFFDAQVEDDARFVTTLARTAAGHGAAIATRVRATRFADKAGRVVGVAATDTESGEMLQIRARHVAVAAGAWTSGLLPRGDEATLAVRPSKGVHIVLPQSALDLETALLARTPTGLLFVIPWQGHWLVGDTDTEWSGEPDGAVAERSDVAALLDRLNTQVSPAVGVDQILGVFAGLRPLVAADPNADTVELSREHAIATPRPGLSVISGGKYTTYRVMAAQLVDAAAADLGRGVPRSPTATIPLLGADGLDRWQHQACGAAPGDSLPEVTYGRLLRRYGSLLIEVLEIIARRPELCRLVEGAGDVLAAEVVYACTHEGARHLDDVLERRTRIAVQTSDGGHAAAEPVARLMGAALGWTPAEVAAEVHQYRQGSARRQRSTRWRP